MYKKIMENFRQLKSNEDLPVQYAEELGLNMNQFNNDWKLPEIAQQIETEYQLKNSGIPRLSVPKF